MNSNPAYKGLYVLKRPVFPYRQHSHYLKQCLNYKKNVNKEKKMKKVIICLVLLVSVLVLGFAQSALSGIYRYNSDYYISFAGNNFTGSWGGSSMSGTYSVSGSRLTLNITGGAVGRNTWNWTIVNASTIRDQDGDDWRKEGGSSVNPPANDGLVVWSFTDEVEGIINNYYRRDNPSVRLRYEYTPTDQFERRLDPVLASGRGTPDVIVLESAFVRKYVEGGQLLDLTDIYERNRSRLLAYPVEIGTYNGRVYALSWQACPGAMFYRRSIARKYLGTDDAAVVQTYFTDLNKLMETAELLKRNSNGSCLVVSSRGDLYNVFLGARRSPWVVNGRLTIDPAMERYMEASKTIYDNRYDARIGMWSEGWFQGMRDELFDSNRRQYEVFSYFLPTWGLHYVLKTNTTRYNGTSTSGDWAMIQGPAPYRWGGTWLGAYRNSPNAAAARQLIEYITTNDSFLERYARDSGDMVSNITVVNRIKNNFAEPFLGGQNHYAAFAEMALGINGRLVQSTDYSIESLFAEQVSAYVNGEKTKERALADFRTQAQRQLGLN